MFRRVPGGLKPSWPRLLMIIFAAVICLASLYRLGTAPAGISPSEKKYIASAQSAESIYKDPANGPHKLLVFDESKTLNPKSSYLRLASVILGLACALCFYILCRNWFGRMVGLMSLAVFVLSPFFLSAMRQVTPEVMRFSLLILLAVYYWHARTDKKEVGWIVLLFIAGLMLYIPGALWWVLSAAIVCRKQLLVTAGRISQTAAAAGLLVLALVLIPIILAFVRDWHFVYDYLLIPQNLPQPIELLKHTGWMVLSLFVRTPYHDPGLIGRLPLLSIIQLALTAFGAYALFSAARKKAAWLTASLIFGILLAALNNDIRILYFSLPALGVFMAAGIRYLYIEWRSVFPRNPIPKSFAIALLTIMVAIQALYGVTYSLVAWPADQQTRNVYVIK
jgi:hypothetical protein